MFMNPLTHSFSKVFIEHILCAGYCQYRQSMPSGKDRNNKQLRSHNIMIKARKKIKQDKSDRVMGGGGLKKNVGTCQQGINHGKSWGGLFLAEGVNMHSSFIHSPHRYFLSTSPVCAGTQTTLSGE